MPKARLLFAAPLALLLAACGGREETTANAAGQAEANASANRAGAGIGQPNASEAPADAPVPPPDAVSHPDGYLPYGNDSPPSSGPEPAADNSSGSREPAPATEDEYIRNKQSGR